MTNLGTAGVRHSLPDGLTGSVRRPATPATEIRWESSQAKCMYLVS
eukprot:COSAG02_NODE_40889_length_400_cov_0.950166_1_plen_45_part_10